MISALVMFTYRSVFFYLLASTDLSTRSLSWVIRLKYLERPWGGHDEYSGLHYHMPRLNLRASGLLFFHVQVEMSLFIVLVLSDFTSACDNLATP